ncbi:MAG: hypothetical protein U0R51_03160 [Solirubrobacterales bacterium]
MSKRTAVLTGLAGAGIGALVGLPYLFRAGECSVLGAQSVQCTMNEAIGPFLSAIAVGFVIAMVVGNAVAIAARRSLAPNVSSRKPPRAAADIEDPAIQLAAWGMPPKAGQRTVSLADPAPRRSTGAGASPAAGAGGGYGAARAARAAARHPRQPLHVVSGSGEHS